MPPWETLLGYRRVEVVGQPVPGLHLWADPRAQAAFVAHLMAQGQVRDFPMQFRHKSGAIRDGLLTGDIIELDGESCLLTVCQDVTERRQAQDRLAESEACYHALFNHSNAGILLTAPDGTILEANAAAQTLLGRSLAELQALGRAGVMDLTDPRLAAALQERAATGHFQGELYCRRADGTRFPAEMSSALFRDRDGQVRSSMIIRDLSARYAAAAALQESEHRFQTFVESLSEGLVITDLADRVVYVNPQLAALTGYTPAEMHGRPAYELLLPPDDWPVMQQRNRDRRQGVAAHYTTAMTCQDGRRIWVEIHAAPVRDAAGTITGTLGALTDITARKQLEEAVQASEARYRALAEAAFEGIVLHEQGRIVDGNPRGAALFGYTLETLRGQRVLDLVAPAAQPAVVAHLQAEYGEAYESIGLRQDGALFPVEVRGQNIAYGGGTVRVTAVRDITARKASEAEREALIAALHSALDRTQTLYQTARALIGSARLPDLLQALVDSAAAALPATWVIAILIDAAQQTITEIVRGGTGGGPLWQVDFAELQEGLSGWVLRERQPALSPQGSADPPRKPGRASAPPGGRWGGSDGGPADLPGAELRHDDGGESSDRTRL